MTDSMLGAAITAVIRGEAASQKMTPADLARAAKVPYPTLWRYLNDERAIPLAVVEKVADAIGKPVSWITERAERRIADEALAAHIYERTGDEQAVADAMEQVAHPADGDHDVSPNTMGKPDKRRRRHSGGTA